MTQRERVPCPLCGGTEAAEHLTAPCPEQPDELFTIRRCADCDMLFLGPRPAPEAMGRYYPDGYYAYRFHGVRPRSHRLKLALWSAVGLLPPPETVDDAPALARLVRAVARALVGARATWTLPAPHTGARFLDIGCGAGERLQLAADLGWEAFGVDLSEQAVSVAREHGFRAVVADAAALPLPAESFDYVSMSHVLEHTPDPLSVLRESARILRPGGKAQVVVPNLSAWSARRFGGAWRHLDLPRHLLHFTPATMRAAARQAGLRVEAMRLLPDRWVLERSMERAGLSGARRRLTRLQWRVQCALGQGEDLNVWLTA